MRRDVIWFQYITYNRQIIILISWHMMQLSSVLLHCLQNYFFYEIKTFKIMYVMLCLVRLAHEPQDSYQPLIYFLLQNPISCFSLKRENDIFPRKLGRSDLNGKSHWFLKETLLIDVKFTAAYRIRKPTN